MQGSWLEGSWIKDWGYLSIWVWQFGSSRLWLQVVHSSECVTGFQSRLERRSSHPVGREAISTALHQQPFCCPPEGLTPKTPKPKQPRRQCLHLLQLPQAPHQGEEGGFLTAGTRRKAFLGCIDP